MSSYIRCPICEHDDWQLLLERVFLKAETAKVPGFHRGVFETIFEIWLPGQESLNVKNLYCEHCGFVCFYPRPTIEDIDRFRKKTEKQSVGYLERTDMDIAIHRSSIMFDYINQLRPMDNTSRILDYGGGDGSLMHSFLAHVKTCDVIDYSTTLMEGVTKLGNTVYDLSPQEKFDIIVCNHIIEHLTAPKETIHKLIEHLSDNGIIFVEVPLELWKYPPLLKVHDPLTHLNFFSPKSLENLFISAGATVIECKLIEYLHSDGTWKPGIRCIGEKQKFDKKPIVMKRPDAVNFLKPGLLTYLYYYFKNPHKLKFEISKRIKVFS